MSQIEILSTTGGKPVAATLTGNSGGAVGVDVLNNINVVGSGGITVVGTPLTNTLTVSLTSGGLTWTDATNAAYNLVAQNGYITNRAGGVTYTLPASGTLGDVINIVGKAGLATIAQNANQQIFIGNTNTTVGVGGTLTAIDAGDCLTLVCITAGASTGWRVDTVIGNWNVV